MKAVDLVGTEGVEVRIADRTYVIVDLSYTQLKYLGKWFADIAQAAREVGKGRSNFEEMLALLQYATEDKAAEFFTIILNEPDSEFIKAEILKSSTIISGLIKIVFEQNEDMQENFRQAMGMRKKPPAATPSNPS